MKNAVPFVVFLLFFCGRLTAQVRVVEDKFIYHSATCRLTLRNEGEEKVFLTGVQGRHIAYYENDDACFSSTPVTIKPAAKYVFYLERPGREYRYKEKTEKLPVPPLEIAPHTTVKIETGYRLEFGTCNGFFYSGAMNFVFSNNDTITRNIKFNYNDCYNEKTTKNEIVAEMTDYATTDAWYVQKMRTFNWDKQQAAALIVSFASRLKAADFGATYYPDREYSGESNVRTIVAATIANLDLDTLSYLVKDYFFAAPSPSLVQSLLQLDSDGGLQFVSDRLEACLKGEGDTGKNISILTAVLEFQEDEQNSGLSAVIDGLFEKYSRLDQAGGADPEAVLTTGLFLLKRQSSRATGWAIEQLKNGTSRQQEKILRSLNFNSYYNNKTKTDTTFLPVFSAAVYDLIDADSANVRKNALNLAVQIPALHPRMDSILIRGLRDPDREIRFIAAWLAGKHDRKALLGTLLENLASRDTIEGFWKYYQAIEDMGLQNCKPVARILARRLSDLNITGYGSFYFALASIDSAFTAPLLRDWLSSHLSWSKTPARDTSDRIMAVLKTLHDYQDVSAIPLITNILQSEADSGLVYIYLNFMKGSEDYDSARPENRKNPFRAALKPAFEKLTRHPSARIRALALELRCSVEKDRNELLRLLRLSLQDPAEEMHKSVANLAARYKTVELKDDFLPVYRKTYNYNLRVVLESWGVKVD